MNGYSKFTDPSSVNDWLLKSVPNELREKWNAEILNRESDLCFYKGAGATKMNECLRKPNENQSIYQMIEKEINGLYDLLNTYKLDESVITYRYVSGKELIALVKGTLFKRIYKYHGFLSTTLLPDHYSMDDIKRKRCMIKILVPKGTPGIIVPEIVPENSEYEWLMPCGLCLKRLCLKTYIIVSP